MGNVERFVVKADDENSFTLSQLYNLPFQIVRSELEPAAIRITTGQILFYAVPKNQWVSALAAIEELRLLKESLGG